MKRTALVLLAGVLVALPTAAQRQFSTGSVTTYVANGCPGPDLPAAVPEGNQFASWYQLAGFAAFSRWTDGNVFGSDFRDGANADFEPNGGSDRPNIYLYAGHGICQNPPNAGSPDFIAACGNFGDPDNTSIGASSRWGNGNLDYMFVDASCPMDLVSIGPVWFGAFAGLHVAVGHSGTSTMDALDSTARGNRLASLTVGRAVPIVGAFLPERSIGDAWMIAGILDIQRGCCAVALAAGNNRNDAIDRRENERVLAPRADPTPNWFAWKWACR